jgi:DNA-binding cell septation regulator SpoVG
LTVVFPTRRDANGREHALVRPVDHAAREAIRQQVLAAAGLEDAP